MCWKFRQGNLVAKQDWSRNRRFDIHRSSQLNLGCTSDRRPSRPPTSEFVPVAKILKFKSIYYMYLYYWIELNFILTYGQSDKIHSYRLTFPIQKYAWQKIVGHSWCLSKKSINVYAVYLILNKPPLIFVLFFLTQNRTSSGWYNAHWWSLPTPRN